MRFRLIAVENRAWVLKKFHPESEVGWYEYRTAEESSLGGRELSYGREWRPWLLAEKEDHMRACWPFATRSLLLSVSFAAFC